jgi:O-antigen ligase
MKKSETALIGRLLSWTAVLATLLVTPWASYDPINVPKLAILVAGGFAALGVLLANRADISKNDYRLFFILASGFFIHLTAVLIFSGTNVYQEFFGASGRSTGYLAYVALLLLYVCAGLSANIEVLKKFFWSLHIAGMLSVAYGLLQALGLDPANWSNPYSPVIGFLGNPNFQSSFIGFTGIAIFSNSLSSKMKIYVRIFNYLFLFLCVLVIKETDSQQGFLVLLGGIAIVLLMWLRQSTIKFLTIPYMAIAILGTLLVLAGSLNKGPLAFLIYKQSVTYRGDYWRAGWKMTVEHPIFGIGLDSYGDWYRRTRSLEATLRRGPEIVSNAAHNVLLDLSSTGGLPLVAIYLLMMLLSLRAGIKFLARTQNFDPIFTGLFAVWVAYQAQSIISLNQLGLAIWGWIISGLLVGYEINSRAKSDALPPKNSRRNKSKVDLKSQRIRASSVLGISLGMTVGLILGMQPLIASVKYKSAIESGNSKAYMDSANLFPKDFIRIVQVVQNLENYGFSNEAIEIARPASRIFPDSFEIWNVYSQLSKASPEELALALRQMRRLDPNNPNLK